jgi:hypothetical protein
MLWAAHAYTRKNTAQNGDWGGGGWRGDKESRKYVWPGVLDRTINSDLNYIKRQSVPRSKHSLHYLKKPTS